MEEHPQLQLGLAALYAGGIAVCLYSFYFIVDLRLVQAVKVFCDRWSIPGKVTHERTHAHHEDNHRHLHVRTHTKRTHKTHTH